MIKEINKDPQEEPKATPGSSLLEAILRLNPLLPSKSPTDVAGELNLDIKKQENTEPIKKPSEEK